VQLADMEPRVSPVERFCVAWSEACSGSDPMGRRQRMLGRLHELMESFCPWAEVIKPGLCALPLRGPARVFGGEEKLVDLIASKLSAQMPLEASPIGIGVADGVFAAYLAARLSLSLSRQGRPLASRAQPGFQVAVGKVLPACTRDWLSPWPIGWLLPNESAFLLERLGIDTIGAFGELDSQAVQERFGTEGSLFQEVARGLRSDPPGFRTPCSLPPKEESSDALSVPSAAAGSGRCPVAGSKSLTASKGTVSHHGQRGLWGDRVDSEIARRKCFLRVMDLLGPESLLLPRVSGSRSLLGEVVWLPWSATGDAGHEPRSQSPREPRSRSPRGSRAQFPGEPSGHPPWPGRLPAPHPILLMEHPVPVELVDAQGNMVGVGPNGLATSAPELLSIDGGSFSQVTAWSGPWPVDERWWAIRRRWARMQVLLSTGRAYLLVLHPAGHGSGSAGNPSNAKLEAPTKKSSWWLEAVYE